MDKVIYRTTTSGQVDVWLVEPREKSIPKLPQVEGYTWKLLNTCCSANKTCNTYGILIWTWEGTLIEPPGETKEVDKELIRNWCKRVLGFIPDQLK